jgi:hypothetical protein
VENLPNGLKPKTISKRAAYVYVGIPSLVQDWMHASRRAKPNEEHWVHIVREGGRGCETLLDTDSVDRAYELFKRGIKPPPIPSRTKKFCSAEEDIS